jgi:Fis family transcriptional regulator
MMTPRTTNDNTAIATLPETERRKQPLRNSVQAALELYFKQLDGHLPKNLYRMVVEEVELPLLKSIMHYCRGNQSKAADVLGINRSTLRKKLKQHGLEK